MYEPLTATSRSGKSAISAIAGWIQEVFENTDGLEFIPPEHKPLAKWVASMPSHLSEWLLDLRLLRHIPLSYLVPDEKLLPTESIRFFHVDPTWTDRVIDGVFSAANIGTVDGTFVYILLKKLREALDTRLMEKVTESVPWVPGKDAMTGMLIRSDLVRRWPDMVVEAYADSGSTKTIGLLRREALSQDILIALFAGQPMKVQIREPNVGVRFGVEQNGAGFQVDSRKENGENIVGASIQVPLRDSATRVLDIERLRKGILDAHLPGDPRMMALHLEQRPFVQTFGGVAEDRGSALPVEPIPMRRGQPLRLDKLAAKLAEAQSLEE
jgi:hypothetical protein